MGNRRIMWIGALGALALAALACLNTPALFQESGGAAEEITLEPAATSTPLLAAPVMPGAEHPDEPVFITGEITFTSPFFLEGNAEPFVLLEDEAGFVNGRNLEFTWSLASQEIGPVELVDDNTLTYSLALPAVPAGTLVDVDNDGETDTGVQVFAVAYWSNTWGGPFLEPRDGRGWSTAYASTTTDPERDYEIDGGTLVVWAPDDQQAFPTGFGADNMLFTADDPTAPIPAGYNLVDLNTEPFQFSKQAEPVIDLIEGESGVNDYSSMGYVDAFDALFNKASVEYPFTRDKGLDWNTIYDEVAPLVAKARDDADFYRAMRVFVDAIPDGHVGMSFNADVFYADYGGSFGLVLAELSDGRVIASDVLPGTSGASAGFVPGTEIITWDGMPISQAISRASTLFGTGSTTHYDRDAQLIGVTRYPPGTRIEVTYQNPGDSRPRDTTLSAQVEYDSLFEAIPSLAQDEFTLPVEGEVLDDSGLGYIRITTFSEDYNLMARLWELYITAMLDNDIPGLIIDVRTNGGGSGGLALDFAGYLFDEEITLSDELYYSEETGSFEPLGVPSRIEPGPSYFDGPVAILVGPDCASACEGFAAAVSYGGRATVVGHMPSAGMYGEVGRGQYDLPGDISLQIPTGRPETPSGDLYIEGVGVVPDITVPITEASALGQEDTVLEAAVDAVLAQAR
jgi:carboxyl-terminal processing protease